MSHLESLGCLENKMDSIKRLALAFTSDNDRPLGGFPEWVHVTHEEPWAIEAVKRTQELLRLHSEVLVEKGLLAK